MSKTMWVLLGMGLFCMVFLTMAMMVTLEQFQETPAAEWVKISEQTAREFKAESVNIRFDFRTLPRAMVIKYTSLVDSHFDLSFQNREMEKVARYVLQNYKEATRVEEVQVTRFETHGRGCFQQTYVGHFTYSNRKEGNPQAPPIPQQR